ncbi:MAG: hypothetical protein PHS41_00480 [Victivallaceae bacterium]|nr:hypothetical protein [Victivallaceae bacterium]
MGKTFLGIGCGPIQTGIYVAGAAQGHFDRIVLADVDTALVKAIRSSGSITVNTAGRDAIVSDTYGKIEIYNPSVPEDLEKLTQAASEAIAINTALPAVSFYRFSAPWLKAGFDRNPTGLRYVYTSENCTVAASELQKLIGNYPNTYFLDTVIGKMSKVFASGESDLPVLAPGYAKGHLVEAFSTIYTTDAPGIEKVGIVNLFAKKDIYPFEEAKLYGHNASHFLLGILAAEKGCRYMSEAKKYPEVIELTRRALREECAPALCRKFAGVDPYFEQKNYLEWAGELLERMTSDFLADSVDRVIRDLDRKLAWNDRVIGAIRLCLEMKVEPTILARGAALAAKRYGVTVASAAWPEEGDASLKNTVMEQILSSERGAC